MGIGADCCVDESSLHDVMVSTFIPSNSVQLGFGDDLRLLAIVAVGHL